MQEKEPISKSATGRSVCVATNPIAAEAGRLMFQRGGNAFDAVAAIGFMEAVVTQHGTGLGGYGAAGTAFIAKSGEVVGIDANCAAPEAARPDMFPIIPGRDPNSFKFPDSRHRHGPLSVAVPGVVAGLCLLVEKHGKLKLNDVINPALEQARAGVTMTRGNATTWYKMLAEANGEQPPAVIPANHSTVLVKMEGVAKTLELISSEGPRVFYDGQIGRDIATNLQKRGGIVSANDMAAYVARTDPAVSVKTGDFNSFTAQPSAGGLTCLQMIALADRYKNSNASLEWGSADWWHGWLELLKTAWEERLTKLADAKYMKQEPQELLSDKNLDRLWSIVEGRIRRPDLGHIVAPDPLRGTIHCAAADHEGNHVSWTQTHGGGYGSQVMILGWEIVLGHGMCRFDPRPGWANNVAPFKRPLHNMCPVISVKNGKSVFSVGAQGGRTIVNNVAAIAVGHIVFGRNAGQSLADPRVQVETMEPFQVEKSVGENLIEQIKNKGHLPGPVNRDGGSAEVISVANENQWIAFSEPRLPRATAVAFES